MAGGNERSGADRRTFLKIGAGVVAGAAIATVVEVPYHSSVIGGNSSRSSPSVSLLKSQPSSTEEQLSATAALFHATGPDEREQTDLHAQRPDNLANTLVSSLNSSVSNANTQVSSLQSAADSDAVFLS